VKHFTHYDCSLYAVVSTPTYAYTFITAKIINIMKTFKSNNMEIVRTRQEQSRFRLRCDLVVSRSKN